jgi:hypothetical protein
MFQHAWTYIIGTTRRDIEAPYWLCSKCGATRKSTSGEPGRNGCKTDK